MRKNVAHPKSLTKSGKSGPDFWRQLAIAPPPLFEGEDIAAYHALLEQISEAIEPADIIDYMLCRDIADLS